MKYHFTFSFTAEFDADTDDLSEVCRAAAKIFEEETKPWHRPDLWRDQINKPDLNTTKNVQVKV